MARADLILSTEGDASPRVTQHGGISIREDLAFTNAKGKEKKAVRKFAEKILGAHGRAAAQVSAGR